MPLIRKPAPAATPATHADLEGLNSPNADDRWAAARAAADVSDSSPALVAALRKEQDPRVREAIFTALARSGAPEGVDELVAMLRSDNASLRTGALDALRVLACTQHAFLPALLRDPDADVRILSCELARGLAADEATGLLATLLMDERQSNVCAAAVDVLAEVGNAGALPALAGCARRFADTPFLVFAIRLTTDRINAQSSRTRD